MLISQGSTEARPVARGKFLWRGGRKLHVRGVTYGTFRPRPDGSEWPSPDRVDADFAAMAEAGFNTVRVYIVPPRWLLDLALEHGLLVMVGHPWEQHVAFLRGRRQRASIEARVRAGVRACAGHPAVLCHTIGNEIPASIVRWHGRRRVERFLERLYRAAKDEDPGGLVTYVNFPTTEYLELPFLDFVAFNVYLEDEERLDAYLARLHVVAGDRPLVMAEIGLDSRRNGVDAQADALEWQLRCVARAGCAGAIVFAWTDEWHRGGYDVEDWDFGLVTRAREPKPALDAVARALDEPLTADWPRMSAVVCSYNGAATIEATLSALDEVVYPDFEVVVVDDGSTDATAEIARRHGVRLISTPNQGLSAARNVGAEAATGEIVAYVDDDAEPDPDWLTHLALAYLGSDHVAVGGPNVPHPDDPLVADCVANAPGGPIHVLLSDTEAEHVPGCNLSIRRDALLAIGGFDSRFHVAGDDVDVCWRLQEAGGTIGFAHGAMVLHRRRSTVRAFWRQQRGYGRAEAMLERKWPEKYNAAGHLSWAGRIYAPGAHGLFRRRRVYYGTWGSGPFQRLYAPGPGSISALPLMPEWLLVILLLTGLGVLGLAWTPLLAALPLAAAAAGTTVAQAWAEAGRARHTGAPHRGVARLRLRAATALLFGVHAHARLWGRLTWGLAPWARRARPALRLPVPRHREVWDERWRAPEERLAAVQERIRADGARVRRGGDFDRWDLEVRGGALGGARLRMAVEEHGGGRQLMRFALRPRTAPAAVFAAALTACAAAAAFATGAPVDGGILAAVVAVLLSTSLVESGAALTAINGALAAPEEALSMERVVGEMRDGEVAVVVGHNGTRHRAMAELLVALYLGDDGDADADVRPVGHGRPPYRIGVMPSRPFVIPGTIADNIALGRSGAAPGEIEAAARTAGVHDFVVASPRGYDTPIADVDLDRECRARLALARALLSDPALLVFDGPAFEPWLADALERVRDGRRTLVASDSLEQLRGADRVVVMDGRRVIAQGPYDELITGGVELGVP